MTKIQFGSGHKILKGYINVDSDTSMGAQVAHNLDLFPYPFKDNYADEIICEMTLEHLKYPTKSIDEFHRILKTGGKLKIIVPHFSHFSAHLADIHICVFNVEYFLRRQDSLKDIWGKQEGTNKWTYVDKTFKDVKVQIKFPGGLLKIISCPFEKIFNISPLFQGIYEHFFSNFYRANEIHVEMIK